MNIFSMREAICKNIQKEKEHKHHHRHHKSDKQPEQCTNDADTLLNTKVEKPLNNNKQDQLVTNDSIN